MLSVTSHNSPVMLHFTDMLCYLLHHTTHLLCCRALLVLFVVLLEGELSKSLPPYMYQTSDNSCRLYLWGYTQHMSIHKHNHWNQDGIKMRQNLLQAGSMWYCSMRSNLMKVQSLNLLQLNRNIGKSDLLKRCAV